MPPSLCVSDYVAVKQYCRGTISRIIFSGGSLRGSPLATLKVSTINGVQRCLSARNTLQVGAWRTLRIAGTVTVLPNNKSCVVGWCNAGSCTAPHCSRSPGAAASGCRREWWRPCSLRVAAPGTLPGVAAAVGSCLRGTGCASLSGRCEDCPSDSCLGYDCQSPPCGQPTAGESSAPLFLQT